MRTQNTRKMCVEENIGFSYMPHDLGYCQNIASYSFGLFSFLWGKGGKVYFYQIEGLRKYTEKLKKIKCLVMTELI